MKYQNKVFAIIKPPIKVIRKAIATSAVEVEEIYKEAKKEMALVYVADAIKSDDVVVDVQQPWVLDESTIKNVDLDKDVHKVEEVQREAAKRAAPPDTRQASSVQPKQKKKPKKVQEDPDLICPYCNKQLNSLSGKTLHIKNKHPEHA